ncbi:nitroreductase/quinone reductase family protein [Nocardiopsis sp. MG754419]|uniref:nitroreductase/quinone reductase family protein n=1 Tax=Nocardiopsis sp. MG754419 TaxID=2259865 RepID=UPI001BABE551|nr:nitroreductase/quinone reductase family protein [Nocardiopsis sp. MG754419]MBR8743357.1 nitroreductase family deazaflavin-dependent oxidoreductase [Nocardiopsis sp. MG754419]
MTDHTTQGPEDPPARAHVRPAPSVPPFEERLDGGAESGDLLLTTTGARTGRESVTPLGYLRIEGRLLVVAASAGTTHEPDWYHDLLAHPLVVVEVDATTFEAVAVPAEGAERDRWCEEIVRRTHGAGDGEARSGGRFPVVELQPCADTSPTEITTLAGKLFEVHGWLRGQLDRVRDEAETYLAGRARAGAPVGLGLQIRQHCLAFCTSLHVHHTGEDTMFPRLAEGYPHLRESIERLMAEHRVVDRIRGELERLLSDLADADPDHFRAELDRMAEQLYTHLEFEEEHLIPVLSRIPFPPPAPAG